MPTTVTSANVPTRRDSIILEKAMPTVGSQPVTLDNADDGSYRNQEFEK